MGTIYLKRILNAKMNRDATWTILRIQSNQALCEAVLILLKFVDLLTENIVKTLFLCPYQFNHSPEGGNGFVCQKFVCVTRMFNPYRLFGQN